MPMLCELGDTEWTDCSGDVKSQQIQDPSQSMVGSHVPETASNGWMDGGPQHDQLHAIYGADQGQYLVAQWNGFADPWCMPHH